MKKIAITLIMLATSISAFAVSDGEVEVDVDPFTDKVDMITWGSNASIYNTQFRISSYASTHDQITQITYLQLDMTCKAKYVNVDIRIDKNQPVTLSFTCKQDDDMMVLYRSTATKADVVELNDDVYKIAIAFNIKSSKLVNQMRTGNTMIVRVEGSDRICKFNLKGVDKMFRTVKKVFHRTLGESNIK